MERNYLSGTVKSVPTRVFFPLNYEKSWKRDFSNSLLLIDSALKEEQIAMRDRFNLSTTMRQLIHRESSLSEAHFCKLGFVLTHTCISKKRSEIALSFQNGTVETAVQKQSRSPLFNCTRLLSA